MARIASATGVPCATRPSTWRSLATISSGVCRFVRIVILLRLASHTSGRTTSKGADHDLAQEFARPVSQGCEHDSSWGTLHLSTKRRNAGTPMLARAGEGFAIRTTRAGAGMTWTKERIELLTKLWAEGLSASQIAAELGGDVSRNSVLGKANRLGLSHGPAKASSALRPCKPPPPKPPFTGGPSSH